MAEKKDMMHLVMREHSSEQDVYAYYDEMYLGDDEGYDASDPDSVVATDIHAAFRNVSIDGVRLPSFEEWKDIIAGGKEFYAESDTDYFSVHYDPVDRRVYGNEGYDQSYDVTYSEREIKKEDARYVAAEMFPSWGNGIFYKPNVRFYEAPFLALEDAKKALDRIQPHDYECDLGRTGKGKPRILIMTEEELIATSWYQNNLDCMKMIQEYPELDTPENFAANADAQLTVMRKALDGKKKSAENDAGGLLPLPEGIRKKTAKEGRSKADIGMLDRSGMWYGTIFFNDSALKRDKKNAKLAYYPLKGDGLYTVHFSKDGGQRVMQMTGAEILEGNKAYRDAREKARLESLKNDRLFEDSADSDKQYDG